MRQHIFNPDFRDFVQKLNACDVAYLLVGGYSVVLHGYQRVTGDMDIWIKPTAENYSKLMTAFRKFGMSAFDMTEEKFLATDRYDVFSFGRPPVALEIMTMVKGLDFDKAFETSTVFQFDDSFYVRTLCLDDLLTAKKAAGRYKDLDDIDHLTYNE
jgi:hypothetical protein